MEIINQVSNEELRILGFQQRTKGKTYRFNKFCLKIETEEGTLIRNYLTEGLVLIKPVEMMNLDTTDPCDYVDYLIGNWFLVPENYDEEEILKVLRASKQVPLTDVYLDHPNQFTILTTTTCNARCFYCYELKSKGKTPMSIETAEKVAKYIIGCAPKDKEIILDWFGGEPLYNMDVIDIICSRVRSAGFSIRSSMVTNGYLFDDKVIKKARNEWNLGGVQITLDGTEEVYNKTKNYIYKDTNPFNIVIANMHKLLENNISISVRMNCDKHNYEDLSNLIDFLHKEFDSPKISYYIWPIFEEGFERTPEERDELYEVISALENKLQDYGYDTGHSNLGGVRGRHCMVDSGDTVCIFPRGEIGICEHYLDSKFVSHIDNPNDKNWETIRNWRDYVKEIDICKDCPIKPGCLKVHGCPDEDMCFPKKQQYLINHDIKGILKIYDNWKNGKTCDCCNKQNSCPEYRDDCPEHKSNCAEHYPTQPGDWKRIMSDGTVIPIKSY